MINFLPYAYGVVDTDIAAMATSTVATLKENLLGVLTTNLPAIILVGVAILAIALIWRLVKRFSGGR